MGGNLKNKNNVTSITMKHTPQLIYHLRRSHFVNILGCTLDESYYFMSLFGREN